MNEDPHQQKTWLERLGHALQREPHNRTELIEILHDAQERHILNHDALHMIEGVLRVSEMQARDVMIPRGQMVVLHDGDTIDTILPRVIKSAHSRFPVIGEDREEIIGILLAKDLLSYTLVDNEATKPIKKLMRPAIFVPESKRLDILLRDFRLKRNHMAIVANEYGGISGLITIEDVLEQIVGQIEDETDICDGQPNIKAEANGEYLIKAFTPIDEFNRFFDLNISDEDFDTLGGFVTQQLGHMPKAGESITINKYQISIVRASARCIQLLKLTESPNEK